MSYNITRWKTKTLEDLTISLIDLCGCFEVGIEDGKVRASGQTEGEVSGRMIDDRTVQIQSISSRGVWSGNAHGEFKEMLSHTKGKLVAILVWEGGDTITKLVVEDGVVNEENVDW